MSVGLIRVAVPGPFSLGLDYIVPPEHPKIGSEALGKRVLVPLGSRTETGLIIELPTETQLPWAKLKAFITILDEAPILTKEQLQLLNFMHDYYHVSYGDAAMTMLPNLLAQGKPLSGRAKKKAVDKTDKNILKEAQLNLNKAQQEVFMQASTALKNFAVFLLEGVTGSGKTEIYLQLSEKILGQGGQVLILVPEIGLTPQTLLRFQQRFNVRIALYHSGMTDAERREVWRQALIDQVDLVIGTRSSVFLPLQRLKLIIIDEEHDLSFKQQTGVHYSAKSLAIKRAQLNNIPIILGSATPTLESLHLAQEGRYQHLKLLERAGPAAAVSYHVLDMRGLSKKNHFSAALLTAMEQHLKKGEQVLIFLNRRGYAPILLCNNCGFRYACNDCDISYTLHRAPAMLMCHHCGIAKRIPNACPQCNSHYPWVTLGVGTEQMEEQLAAYFPDYPLVRVDQDATRLKGSLEKILAEISQGRAKIIIGTQMLAKGHHFSEITMVGIIDLDYGLFAPDFRALERMGQLLLQVAGRAGREHKAGHVYLQTHQPEHPLLELLLTQGYPAFAQALLQDRQASHWPPFSYLALLRAEGKIEQEVYDFLTVQKNSLRDLASPTVQIFGPVPAFLSKKAGKFRAQLLLQAKTRKDLHYLLLKLEQQLTQHPVRRVRWGIDVDPLELG
jgi:primosomal protein N' (replication factor Y)